MCCSIHLVLFPELTGTGLVPRGSRFAHIQNHLDGRKQGSVQLAPILIDSVVSSVSHSGNDNVVNCSRDGRENLGIVEGSLQRAHEATESGNYLGIVVKRK